VIVFPNCKINLGLHILQKRSDGYHNIETVFYPIPLTDILEITEYKGFEKTPTIPFTRSGFVIDGDVSNNLCIKAYKLLKRDFPKLPHVQIHLHKSVPTGAGLGAGSSDATFTLKLLNEKFSLGISDKELKGYALELGSDCPFFIINKPCFAKGRGEILEPIDIDLSGYKIVVANPGIHINTGRAFLNIEASTPVRSLKEILTDPIERWKDYLQNDFEQWVFKQHSAVVELKDQLYAAGAVYASMSGSGSTVFGIFKKEKVLQLSFPDNYFVKELNSQLQ
jgi:4-diphosphocytidyl-2-C-methyl-D-erythritol kinase